MSIGIDRERGRRILVLAGPIIVAMFTQTFINVVDTIFVGKLDPSYSIPGQSALGFSLPLLWAFGGSLSALGVGTQAMTARRFGSKDDLGAGVVVANSLVVTLVSSLVFTVLAWFLVPVFFEFLTNNRSVIELGVPYARVRILGITAMVMTAGYKGFFDGIGKTRVHMYAALIMNGANIVLNYLLIFGAGPIPPLFVTGAAVASVIASFLGLVVMALWSFRKKYLGPHRYYRLANLQPRVMWEITKLSAPSGAAQVFVMSGVLLFLKIVGMLDDRAMMESVAAAVPYATEGWAEVQNHLARARFSPAFLAPDWGYAVVGARPPIFTTAAKLIIDLLSIGFVTCIAFGTATATLVSQSMGEGDFDSAEAYGWDSVKLGGAFFGLVGVAVIVFPEFFLDLLSDDATVITAAVPGLRVMASLEVLIATALVLTQALFGAGATKFVMWTELVLHGLCLAPLAWLFGLHFELGFLGVWLSAAVYTVALGGIMAWKFAGGSWKTIQV